MSPNLLTCTPTLEMGIDVGDLSSTMVCSVPPTATNYLQRIGRAGRATGNALILALANVKPHDLYFFDDPLAMIAGVINPPGCYLDAPEMLKCQYLAFGMDTWASEAPNTGVMPPKVMLLLAGNKRGEFPANFLQWYVSNRDCLCKQFLGLFEGFLSEENIHRMQEFALSDSLPGCVNECLKRTELQIDDYRRLLDRVRERRNKIEEAPEKTDNVEEVLDDLRQDAGVLRRLIAQVQEKYPLNLFTDEGLLPNYAFPETGVKLKSMIYGIIADEGEDKDKKVSQAQEYLRELARPFGSLLRSTPSMQRPAKSLLTKWRREAEATHRSRTGGSVTFVRTWQGRPRQRTKQPVHIAAVPGWADVGQRRNLLKLVQVSARSDNLCSRTSDDSDERDRKIYLLKDFIDIQPDNWGGGYADHDGPFGFEYLKQVTLREINFGTRGYHGTKIHGSRRLGARSRVFRLRRLWCCTSKWFNSRSPSAVVLLHSSWQAGGMETFVSVSTGAIGGHPAIAACLNFPGRDKVGHV